MFNTAIKFGTYPPSVKKGIACLTLGWLGHLIFYFNFFTGDVLVRNDYLMAGIGIAICYFVAAINTWARALSIFFNIGILAIYLALLAFQNVGFELQVLTVAVIVLFALATYYLLRKETAEFFGRFNA
ncbi:MAG: hypothetical protein WAL90_16045 [Desulfobacterales bacterium]